MSEAERFAELINRQLPRVKKGTLRFWGEWFGRPHDNIHTLIRCDAKEGVLRLTFNGDERLCVWSPSNLIVDESVFQISDAQRVRWEWFYYGRPKTESNLQFMDLQKSSQEITVSKVNRFYSLKLDAARSLPAVEIL